MSNEFLPLKEWVKTASLSSLLYNHFKYSELAGQFYSDEDFEPRGRCLEKSKLIRDEIIRRFDVKKLDVEEEKDKNYV